jgi:hypothetical protein
MMEKMKVRVIKGKPEKRHKIVFNKIDYLGHGRKNCMLEAEVSWNGVEFTVSADVWNARHTDIYMGGQCLDTVNERYRDQIRNLELWDEVVDLWRKYHLNTMQAGTPEQMKALEDWKRETGHPSWNFDYEGLCEYLKGRNLYFVPDPENPGKTYEFGTRWLTKEIPEEDRKRMDKLMEA